MEDNLLWCNEGKDWYAKTLHTICKLGIKGKLNKTLKKNGKKRKTASSPCQDLHPDWDRFRGTMLYPLSCGELAMKGDQILRLYVASTVCIARKKWAKILSKMCFDSNMTLLQKLCFLIY